MVPAWIGNWRGSADAGMGKLRKSWHARLFSLRAAGVPWLPEPHDVVYAMNCPPFCVDTYEPVVGRYCNRALCCPFCFARKYPLRAFDALKNFAGGYSLLEFSSTRVLWKKKVPEAKFRAAASDWIVEAVRRDRGLETKGSAGSVVMHRVDFGKESWSFVRSGLILVPAGKKPPPPPEDCPREERKRTLHASYTREALGRVVGRAFRFPAGGRSSDPADVVALVKAGRPRMFELRGLARAAGALDRDDRPAKGRAEEAEDDG